MLICNYIIDFFKPWSAGQNSNRNFEAELVAPLPLNAIKGVWIRWTGTVEWNGGMDWTGMDWNGMEWPDEIL